MDINARYSLEFNPFLKNSKDIILESAEYKEALFRLDYLAKTNGFGLITGSPGRGKTTVVRAWAASLNPSLYKVIYTSFASLSVNDFYRELTLKMGSEPSYRKAENFNMIQDAITRLAVEKHKTPVIIIDEVDHISSNVLYDLKMLFNFDMDSKDRAIVLLVGLPKINNTLNLTAHEPLRQRIIMNYCLEGLSKDEGRQYIARKLEGAGCHQTVFDEGAIEAILNAADGTPRMINKYCNTALIIGNSLNLSVINADTVCQAVNDSTLG